MTHATHISCWTRRRFLAAATGALAAPLILPHRARGANERLQIGLIGSGSRGEFIMTSGFEACPEDMDVVAVCDVQQARRDGAAAKVDAFYGREPGGHGCAIYEDFRDLLAREDIDAVIIAPLDHWHAVMVEEAARRKKHMYCEKPLGVSVQECVAVRKAVRDSGVVFQTGTQQRSDEKFRFACELARNGYLGDLSVIEVATPGRSFTRKYAGEPGPQPVPPGLNYDLYQGPAPMKPFNPERLAWPDWYLLWDYCTGFIVNWGVHHLDIALWGCPRMGEGLIEVACEADYRNEGLSDNINGWRASYAIADGLRLEFSDTDHPFRQGCCFRGSEGWVHVSRKGIEAEPASLLEQIIGDDEIQLHRSTHHFRDFVDAVKMGGQTVSPVESGCQSSYFGMIAEIAARLKRPLRWDAAEERFVDDAEANALLMRPRREPWGLA